MDIMKRIAVVLGSSVVGLSLLVAACDRNAGAAAGAAGTSAAAPAEGVAGPSVDATNYKIELKSGSSYAANKEATFEIVVTTKGEYHVNDEFPTKFKTLDTNKSVTYPQAKIEKLKDAAAFTLTKCSKDSKDSCTMKVTVKFTPTAAGKQKVGGELSFGVCNKDSCLIEKKALDAEITVN